MPVLLGPETSHTVGCSAHICVAAVGIGPATLVSGTTVLRPMQAAPVRRSPWATASVQPWQDAVVLKIDSKLA